jgi:hypothetical protein
MSGPRGRRQGHVLVVRLIGGCAALQEIIRRIEALRAVVGVIVLHFVIIPGHQPREGGVR